VHFLSQNSIYPWCTPFMTKRIDLTFKVTPRASATFLLAVNADQLLPTALTA